MKACLAILLGLAQAGVPGMDDGARHLAAGVYDYKTNGRDWPNVAMPAGTVNRCGEKETQSPIDLPGGNGPERYRFEDDNFNKAYYDQVKTTWSSGNAVGIEVKWVGDTSKVSNLATWSKSDGVGKVSFFYSEYGAVLGGPTQYGASQFHFHTGSEHTVDGVRHDLEMHTVHYPKAAKGGIVAAAMGIFFSADPDYYSRRVAESPEQVAIIDKFFTSLMWDKKNTAGAFTNPRSPKVFYGELMMMVNMRTRWTYKGSVTTPPCATTVYWNVVKTIYPIKQMHLNQFKAQMQRGTVNGTDKFGADVSNWREIQPLGDRIVTHIVMPPRGGSAAGVVILLLILIGLGIGMAVCYHKGHLKWDKEGNPPAKGEAAAGDTEFSSVAPPAPAAPTTEPVNGGRQAPVVEEVPKPINNDEGA